MTTVAVRDGVMAADTLLIRSEVRCSIGKIFRRDYGLVGGAGSRSDILRLLEWYDGDRRGKPDFVGYGDDRPEVDLLILERDGGLVVISQYLVITRLREPFFAIGSGAAAALGAMHAGCDARRAVEIAARVDVNTQEPVEWATLDELPARRRRRAG
ncbi:MAG TPA: hypothetical protein VLG66_04720 [Alphaproteobacteria bacterium]|nr:hypothetical protein [Alphaproteobacteria bacterium]